MKLNRSSNDQVMTRRLFLSFTAVALIKRVPNECVSNDAAFVEYRRFTVGEICRVYKVPTHMVTGTPLRSTYE